MEANVNGGTHRFLNGSGEKGLEWDLNDWRWDGDLFLATPVNAVPSDCRNERLFPVPSSVGLSIGFTSCSSDNNEIDHGMNGKGKGELEKRRKIIAVEDNEPNVQAGSLALKLAGPPYPVVGEDHANGVGNDNKERKVQAGSSNRGMCQVEGCAADLSRAKDYHRRHKVCEMHAKANKALVGNVIQRFCQQCSRFHLLQEFDEGKRSCRRRLAGHNRRRRKTPIDAAISENPLTDARSSTCLLTSLPMTLSNLQTKNIEQLKDQDLLSHFLRNLANLADSRNLSALLRASQDPKIVGNSAGISSEAAQAVHSNDVTAQESFRPSCPRSRTNYDTEVRDSARKSANESMCAAVPAVELPRKRSILECSPRENIRDSTMQRAELTVGRSGPKNFDLNDVYNGEYDIEETEKSRNPGTTSLNRSWMMQDSRHSSSPPQISGNSDSASVQSLVSSNGDARGQTDRIAFKLFGKDPKDFPLFLRAQILDWLSDTPTDIESYIKPGCIILTVYLQLSESTWEELCNNLCSNLRRLLDLDRNGFWRTGWMYVRVRHQMAFVYNGQLVVDSPLLGVNNKCTTLSVTPIAVSISTTVKFTIKGFNIAWSSMRLRCAFEGRYLVQETAPALVPSVHVGDMNDGPQFFSFSCSLPNTIGRGFVEVEDHSLGGAFFPFIVAEPEVCSEICMLEGTIDAENTILEKSAGVNARALALDFLHEMGWLLHRCQLRSRSPEDIRPYSIVFPLKRFKWLMEFSMEHEWLAVVRKLLNILVGGVVDMDGHPVEHALEEMSLLHDAVRKNSRSIVEFFLCYVPNVHVGNIETESTQVGRTSRSFLFRADMTNTERQTPLHIAASQGDTQAVLDALTDDPLQLGIAAWKSACDSAGLTPEDHARSNGYEAYLHLVEKKINKKYGASHVVLDIPETSAASHGTEKQGNRENCNKQTTFEINKSKSKLEQQPYCNVCSRQQLASVNRNRSTLLYRPAMLSMVGIATVCICVGLLLKGLPEVHYVHSPFRWEAICFGSM